MTLVEYKKRGVKRGIFGGYIMTKSNNMFEVFFRKYGSVLAKEVDCTYSHTVKILQEMEKAELVSFEKQGRIKTISLTENGVKVAENIEKIRSIL